MWHIGRQISHILVCAILVLALVTEQIEAKGRSGGRSGSHHSSSRGHSSSHTSHSSGSHSSWNSHSMPSHSSDSHSIWNSHSMPSYSSGSHSNWNIHSMPSYSSISHSYSNSHSIPSYSSSSSSGSHSWDFHPDSLQDMLRNFERSLQVHSSPSAPHKQPQGPPPAYSASNPVGGAHTNLHEPPPAYNPSHSASGSHSWDFNPDSFQDMLRNFERQFHSSPSAPHKQPQGPPPAYSASNPEGGAHTNIHEPPPAYNPSHNANPPSYSAATNTQTRPVAEASGSHYTPSTNYWPRLGVHHRHTPSGGSYPRQQGNDTYQDPEQLPAGATYHQPGLLPAGAIYYPQAPAKSSSGLGLGTGLIPGALGGAILGHALTPTETQVVDHGSFGSGGGSNGGDDKITIINNGQPGSVTTSEVGSPPAAAAEYPSTTLATPPSNDPNAQAPPASGLIVCVPMRIPEPDPNDASKTIEVEKVACYPAPPPEAAPNATESVTETATAPAAAPAEPVPAQSPDSPQLVSFEHTTPFTIPESSFALASLLPGGHPDILRMPDLSSVQRSSESGLHDDERWQIFAPARSVLDSIDPAGGLLSALNFSRIAV